ncbi:MAG: transglycosylase SLT domain-containing protein [Gaiellales bacterium]
MRRIALTVATVGALLYASPAVASVTGPDPGVAALQIALRHHGEYGAQVDGLRGPLTNAGLDRFRSRHRIRESAIGPLTRRALGPLGAPLLGQRLLGVGAVGWDVSALEFRLLSFGLRRKELDGRFTASTAAALRRFQQKRGLDADGLAGVQTYRALASRSAVVRKSRLHTVRPGESFFSIAQLHRTSPLLLARENGLSLASVIIPGQKLALPAEAVAAPDQPAVAATPDVIRSALDHWADTYGVDPKLARAVAWMESGFQQDVVSEVGAIGVMQLLPETWAWLDTLLGVRTPRTYDGNIRAGVRYLRWLLDEFEGDTRLALAGYYQGAAAVRQRGLFDDTKRYVRVVLQLRGSV